MAYNETPTIEGAEMNNKFRIAKKFVSDHRVAIAIIGTASVCAMLRYRNAKELNAFLAEHNLLVEFYTPENSY
jgi:hypothetical protein